MTCDLSVDFSKAVESHDTRLSVCTIFRTPWVGRFASITP